VVHESELRSAEHLVEDGEALVARQRDLIRRLSENGHPTEPAERVLVRLEGSLDRRREYLRRVLDPRWITAEPPAHSSPVSRRPDKKPSAPDRGNRRGIGGRLAEVLGLRLSIGPAIEPPAEERASGASR
jgi:hypothetical protein